MSDQETRLHQPVKPGFLGRGRTGVVVAGAIVGVVVIAAGVLLFVLLNGPLGGFQRIDSNNPSASHPDGITVALQGDGSLRLRLGSVPREVFVQGDLNASLARARGAVPSYLQIMSPIYTIESRGEGPVTVSIAIPNAAEPYHTLDLYQWDDEQGEWKFVPGHVDVASGTIITGTLPGSVAVFQASPVTPLISTVLEDGQQLEQAAVSALNLVMPAGYVVQPDGAIQGAPVSGWQAGVGYAVAPVVRAADSGTLGTLLNTPSSRAIHVEELKALVVNNGFNGVALDYGAIGAGDRAAFAQFVSELSVALKEANKAVIVVLPAPAGGSGAWDTGGYDWQAIGAAADIVVISSGTRPGAFAVNGEVISMLGWAVGEISRYKLHLASSVLSYDETAGALISYQQALEPLGMVTVAPALPTDVNAYQPGTDLSFGLSGEVTEVLPDQNTGAWVYSVSDAGNLRRIWVVTANAMRARLDMISNFNIGGISLRDLGAPGNDPALPQAVNEFRIRNVSTVATQLIMQWTLTDASGAVLTNNTGLGTPWLWRADFPGSYSVQGAVVGSSENDRGAVNVQVAAEVVETETPTPSPTARPTTTAPTGTRTPTATPAPTTPRPTTQAPPPVAQSGWGGGFALGGQVPGFIGHSNEMRTAAMSWVKFQLKWFPGTDPSAAAGMVSAARANGFKILISIPGPPYPESINFTEYVNFLRGVASYQPDAIEVWNEMNLDREWPAGQIDPASYVNNMLAPGYNAIKSVSPGTKVIIGALAPTGFDNGTNAWSDQRYTQGLAAAGAARYADCMGVHHNSGTTSPSVRSGRPEGDHYSWYYMPTIEVAYTALNGALPICITEFGYMTMQGINEPIPPTFAWGATNTLQNQVDWLAEGVRIAKGTGYIPLVIVWNVDFTGFSQYDPQAAYAIVRPDGSCPACVSLGAAVP
jgi:spore germination protein YaaH